MSSIPPPPPTFTPSIPAPNLNPGSPPSVFVPSFTADGFDSGNAIIAGYNNEILGSCRSTIINGQGNYITNKYNTHILGDFVSPLDPSGTSNGSQSDLVDNAFYIGCINGVHSYGDVVAYAASDKRLKDNIKSIKDPLSKILSLDSVSFDWNKKQETYKGRDIGLIAQQVKKIAPELVATRENGYLAIKYDKLTTLLVGAIKEQQGQIDVLSDRVESLLKKLDSMS